VADKLKMPKDIVLARASTYRGAGIRLKKMPRHSNKALDVQALNNLIDNLDRKMGKEPTPVIDLQPEVLGEAADVRSNVKDVLRAVHSREETKSTSDQSSPKKKATAQSEVNQALTTTFFECSHCKVRTYFREIVLDVNQVIAVDPTGDLVCKGCGHRFTQKEKRPFPSGVMRSGWWFPCIKCNAVGYVDVTADGSPCRAGHPKEVPPAKVKCENCGEENQMTLTEAV
jgi:transcription elongation factor Elf1